MNAEYITKRLKTEYCRQYDDWNEKCDYVNQIIISDIPKQEDIARKQAARIIHEFLQKIIGEQDEEDWEAAKVLKDIYDCRVCMRHIAQLYVKGIMLSTASDCFGVNELLGENELEQIARRIFDRNERHRGRENHKNNILNPIKILEYRDITAEYIVIDVRSKLEYEKEHKSNMINIPLAKITDNPKILDEYKGHSIAFWCEGGYMSKIAAQIAVENGNTKVSIIKS